MKRIYVIFLLIITAVLGMLGMKVYQNQKAYNDASKITVEYLKSNFNDIKTVDITETEYSPVGTIFVKGYINGERDSLTFTSNVDPDEEIVKSVTTSEDFPEAMDE
ncbi:archaellum component FlaG (FlaF/FlaG flagellin family) [Peribacillus deserti]|uniref:Archaellum component FlaG (FlaF/FlaG flagellin family) n=1 Tax=Peribacillus deserti TaxID=673318 RepID=A0ABS2QC74_9BACI|nr:DUF1433 domain-containing protein [Peribacillus deserti]MBM7690767.1 archaellum component FlaG (FlaF/FlaG flagellin family) [Peribacillus deserti]